MVAALAALTLSSVANANWYVQGDLGYSKLKTHFQEGDSISKSQLAPSISVGYKFNNFRLGIDYSHYGKINHNNTQSDIVEKFNLKINSFGISTFYDFDLNSDFAAFVGARLSMNKIKWNYNMVDSSDPSSIDTESVSDTRTKLGYGVVTGVSYKLSNNLFAQAAVEYQQLVKIEGDKINQYGAKIGLRYEF
ncbi:opacity protein [Canicola haemoglobinophilus]|uniref:Opacity protein n=1 Tax=Canicola haemoglobinophilus TaxID=733 RepID=A0A377I759_9PAST|nr:opacity family porin [Canicola haemoglobinophilus]STO71011.1 opacity protein [Canicola haemoglobinophilus]